MKEIQDLLRICKAFAALGWSVQEQADQLLTDDDLESLNVNAASMIERDFLALIERTDIDWAALKEHVEDVRADLERYRNGE